MNIFILPTQHIWANYKKRCNIGKLTFLAIWDIHVHNFPQFISLCKSFLKSSLDKKLKNKENLKLCQYGLLDQHIWRPLFLYGKKFKQFRNFNLVKQTRYLWIFKPFLFWFNNLHINGHFDFVTKCNLMYYKRLKRKKYLDFRLLRDFFLHYIHIFLPCLAHHIWKLIDNTITGLLNSDLYVGREEFDLNSKRKFTKKLRRYLSIEAWNFLKLHSSDAGHKSTFFTADAIVYTICSIE